jgi:hypothetical protein
LDGASDDFPSVLRQLPHPERTLNIASDPEIAEIVTAWPMLAEHVRSAVLSIIRKKEI